MSEPNQRVYNASNFGTREQVNELLRQSAEADKGCQSIDVYIAYLGSLTRKGDTSITAEIEDRCNYDQDIREAARMVRSIWKESFGVKQLSSLAKLLLPAVELDLMGPINDIIDDFTSNPKEPQNPQSLRNELEMHKLLLDAAKPESKAYDYFEEAVNSVEYLLQ